MSRRLLLPMLLLAALASMGVGEGVGQWRPPQYTTDPGSMVNVRDFGAVGDGVADDLAAIEAAILSLGTGGAQPTCADGVGGTVFVPNGIYNISSTLNVPHCVILAGEGRSSTVIRAAAGFAGSTAVISLCEEATNDGHGCSVTRLDIDGNTVADYGLLTEHSAEGSWIRDFIIRQVKTYGIFMNDPAVGTEFHRFIIENGEINFGTTDATDVGIQIDSISASAMTSIRDVTIYSSDRTAGATAISSNANLVLIQNVHTEWATGVYVNAGLATIINLKCLTPVVCLDIASGILTTRAINIRGETSSTATIRDNNQPYTTTAVNVPGYDQARPGSFGAVPPATCLSGEIFLDTDETVDTNCTTTADNSLCLCVSTNVWVQLNNN